ncbi:hypothetical protein JOD48_001487 [Oerskovia paurometabola]|nr:hypothetical protein [Oerskovia paurometabola]
MSLTGFVALAEMLPVAAAPVLEAATGSISSSLGS